MPAQLIQLRYMHVRYLVVLGTKMFLATFPIFGGLIKYLRPAIRGLHG